MNRTSEDAWISQVVATLRESLSRSDMPILDIEWLILRCEDTLRYTGDLRHASARQLIKDLESFNSRFPGALSQQLLLGPMQS